MKEFLSKENFKKAYPHLIAITIFLILVYIYFAPQLSGYNIRQDDWKTYVGMSQEIRGHWEKFDEDPLWTNSMFSGMPAYQIVMKQNVNWIKLIEAKVVLKLLKYPAALIFIAMISFYIMLMCFKIDPWISIIGSVVYGFAAINILYLGAGHVTKVHAIGLLPLVVGGVIYTYRREMIIGGVLTALFLCLQVSANHLQETYYLIYLLLAIVIVEFYRHFKSEDRAKQLKKFAVASGILIAAALIGILPVYSHLKATADYSKATMRGTAELTLKKTGDESKKTESGLDEDYITQYSLGKGEVWSLVVPDVKGVSGPIFYHYEDIAKDIDPKYKKEVENSSAYWGEQRTAGGTFYLGVGMFLLFVLAMVFIKDKLKWGLLAVAVLAIMLSWKHGDLTNFFIHNIPMFSKFRDTKMILVLVQLILPLLGVMFLKKFIEEGVEFKKLLIVLGSVVVIFGSIYMMPETFFDFSNEETDEMYHNNVKAKLAQEEIKAADFDEYKDELIETRVKIFRSDMGRSLFIIMLVGSLLIIYSRGFLKNKYIFLGAMGLIVLVDVWMVDKRYLNNEMDEKDSKRYKNDKWVEEFHRSNPYVASPADIEILRREKGVPDDLKRLIKMDEESDKPNLKVRQSRIEKEKKLFADLNYSSNFRVHDYMTQRSNTWANSSRAAYYHKALGGYHGAKLKRYQDLITFHLNEEHGIASYYLMQSVQDPMNPKEKIPYYAVVMNLNYFEEKIQELEKIKNLNQQQMQELQQLKNYVSAYTPVERQFKNMIFPKMTMMNMLNTKYLIDPANAGIGSIVIENDYALGNAWFVSDYQIVENANEEMIATFVPDSLAKYKGAEEVDLSPFESTFNPAKLAIINKKFESQLDGLKITNTPGDSIYLVAEEYKPNHLKYKYRAKSDQLAVFSEIYYQPGWQAYIDGEPVDHFQVNYVLRGMKLPSTNGEWKEIEFKFEPKAYYTGQKISIAGSILLILLVIGAIVYQIKFRKPEEQDAIEE
jgi:hypothetical protein